MSDPEFSAYFSRAVNSLQHELPYEVMLDSVGSGSWRAKRITCHPNGSSVVVVHDITGFLEST